MEIAKTVGDFQKVFDSFVEDYNGKRFVDPTSYEFKMIGETRIQFRKKTETEIPLILLLEELAASELNTVKEIIELEPENSLAQA